MIRACIFVVAFLILWVQCTLADVIHWSFQDVRFDDGGTASGSFSYDADNGVYSSISITTNAGSRFLGASYVTYDPMLSSPTQLWAFAPAPSSFSGLAVFKPVFSSPLTDAGGTIALLSVFLTSDEEISNADFSQITVLRMATGSVTSVPESSAAQLIVLGLLAVFMSKLLPVYLGASVSTDGSCPYRDKTTAVWPTTIENRPAG